MRTSVAHIFKYIDRRLEAKRQLSNERVLERVFNDGAAARLALRPCVAPAGYDSAIGIDVAGAWVAGWVQADREQNEEKPATMSPA